MTPGLENAPKASHMQRMTQMLRPLPRLVLCAALAFAPLPVVAQTEQPAEEDGMGLIEEGLRLLFKGLRDDMEPALDDMAKAMEDLKPMLSDLAAMIGDIHNYQAPEQLPNGDIILRRKPGAPPFEPPKPLAEGEIEL
jgi:hypothetical protein